MKGWMLSLLLGSSPAPCPTANTDLGMGESWTLQQVALCIGAGETPRTETISQWLAMKRIDRLDEAITDAEARAYTPTHRRLLTDAVHANRGRKSPAPEHDAILLALPWYSPSADYTDQLLNAVDRENLEKLAHPPAAKPDPLPNRDTNIRESRGCLGGYGCTTAPTSTRSWGWFWAVLLFSSRRRAGETPSARTQKAAQPHPV